MASIFEPSAEKTNGTKLARLLIDGGTQGLKNVLESFIHPPSTLQIMLNNNKATLVNLKSRSILNDSQWERLFPPSGDPPDSNTFDITLLHLLLRKVCPALTEPATGWNEMPADADHSREAEIARIKYFRNRLCHSISTGVPNDEFEDKWNTISPSLVALGVDQLEINCLKTQDIDHGTQRRIDEEIEKWKLEFEPRMKVLEHEVQQLKGQISNDKRPSSEQSGSLELPNCLPDEAQDVFGRSEEIQRAVGFVQSGTVSIVALTGGPGFGKTTVANKVAHELAKRKNSRTVLYCSLTFQSSLNDIFTKMILACSKSLSQPTEHPKHWLLNWSKQQSGKVTLILDSADRVLESEDRHKFVDMLREMRTLSRQNLTFITTSRKTVNAPSRDLNIRNIRLSSLSLSEATNVLLSKVGDLETRQELSQKEKLVSLCGCVPLALCIVGSLLSDYKEDKLIDFLENKPLDVLQDNDLSVEKAIKTSFDLLTEAEQKALAIMSVFPGSFDSDAAEAVITAVMVTEVRPVSILQSLRNRSLLEQPSSRRFEILQLIKMFLSKDSQAKHSQAVTRGKKEACAHFICRLASNANMYWSKDKCKESILEFSKDRHNFEYFLEVYIDTIMICETDSLQTSSDFFLKSFPQKCMYLEMCLLPSFYTKILEELWKYFHSISHPVHIVEVLCLLGHEKRKVGKIPQYKFLMNHAKQTYSKNYKAFKTNGLSHVYFFNSYAYFLGASTLPGKYEMVSKVYEIALILCNRELNKHPETAATLQYIGRHRKSMEHLQKAMDMFNLCLGEHFMTAQCHKAIGDFYFGPSFYRKDNNEMEKCFEHYGAARTLMRNLGVGDHKESILTLKNYGVCCKSKENYHEAISVLTKAKQVADIELEEDHKWKVMIETQLALVYDCAGNAEKAEQIMGKALNMNKRLKQSISQLANKKEIWEFLERHPQVYQKLPMRMNSRS
ncbi:uncharacterized protein LOC111326986 [Stylophora pistillata]|uniref:uncharacterized protein LOC111326986 n=1 Tax=Stylophora pistillata TaxID=50429 RepID=UPI000C040CAA|nr:uncharacterized protein LOC111326986 [Stylophora pistillata]